MLDPEACQVFLYPFTVGYFQTNIQQTSISSRSTCLRKKQQRVVPAIFWVQVQLWSIYDHFVFSLLPFPKIRSTLFNVMYLISRNSNNQGRTFAEPGLKAQLT